MYPPLMRTTFLLVGATALAFYAACGGDSAPTDAAGAVASVSTSASTGPAGGAAGAGGGAQLPPPTVEVPTVSLSADAVGVLVNPDDPQSVAVAKHYVEARNIPASHVYEVKLTVAASVTAEEFDAAKKTLDAAVDPAVQAWAITWTQPYAVGCMSLTSAFALGFDTKYCNTTGGACGPTAPSPYFDSPSSAPFQDHGLRPAMALVGKDTASALALIDRGVAADGTFPPGDGYLLRTTDVARSVRWPDFMATTNLWDHPDGLKLTYLDNASGSGKDYLENTKDVLFYFTGLADVPALETNTYRPGAVADHLTSFGGQVPTSGQMSIAKWLEAGATASYGTAFEPCNYPTKFPSPKVMLPHYFRGETVLEAYWKSVRWPGEGVFVGDPLARPWGTKVDATRERIVLDTTSLDPKKTYELVAGPGPSGPFQVVAKGLAVPFYKRAKFTFEAPTEAHYVLRESP